MNLEMARVKFSELSNQIRSLDDLTVEGPAVVGHAFRFYLWAKNKVDQTFEIPYDQYELAFFCLLAKKFGLPTAEIIFTGEKKPSNSNLWDWNQIDNDQINSNSKFWMRAQIDSWTRAQQVVSTPTIHSISIVIPHYNRSHLLADLLHTLSKQSDLDFEVVIGDDFSSELHVNRLKQLQKMSWPFKLKIHFQASNKGARANRNLLATLASNSFLLFVDDDNLLLPTAIESARRAIGSNMSDIYVFPFWRTFSRPTPEQVIQSHFSTGILWVPLGGGGEASYVTNTLGDMSFLISKNVFFQLAGLSENSFLACEDWEFLIRSRLKGFYPQVVPEILQVYCDQPNSFLKRVPTFFSHLNAIAPASWIKTLPPLHLVAQAITNRECPKPSNSFYHGAIPSNSQDYNLNLEIEEKKSGNYLTLSIAAGSRTEVQVTIVTYGPADSSESRMEIVRIEPGINIMNISFRNDIKTVNFKFPIGLFFLNQVTVKRLALTE